jgi:mycoredoxin-dependent peroxiredoxin
VVRHPPGDAQGRQALSAAPLGDAGSGPLSPGLPAPDFELPDQHGTPVRLSHFRRRSDVLLVFYPAAFSTVCTGELAGLQEQVAAPSGDQRGLQVLAVSCDSVHAQRAWAERRGFTFPLLSDFWPHGAVAREYGVFNPARGTAGRGSFLVDADGVVRWSLLNPPGVARDPAAHLAALAEVRARRR